MREQIINRTIVLITALVTLLTIKSTNYDYIWNIKNIYLARWV